MTLMVVVASIARKNPYFFETMKHNDIIDLKQLKRDMKVTNVKKDEEGQKVRWNNDGSITWMRFEKDQPDTTNNKVNYDQDTPFKMMKVFKGWIQTTKRVQIKIGNFKSQAWRSDATVQRLNDPNTPPSIL